MSDMQINLNQKCTVTLNERGVEALRVFYQNLSLPPPDYKAGDEYTAELWDVMHIFGPYTFMGAPTPFDTSFKIHNVEDWSDDERASRGRGK